MQSKTKYTHIYTSPIIFTLIHTLTYAHKSNHSIHASLIKLLVKNWSEIHTQSYNYIRIYHIYTDYFYIYIKLGLAARSLPGNCLKLSEADNCISYKIYKFYEIE